MAITESSLIFLHNSSQHLVAMVAPYMAASHCPTRARIRDIGWLEPESVDLLLPVLQTRQVGPYKRIAQDVANRGQNIGGCGA